MEHIFVVALITKLPISYLFVVVATQFYEIQHFLLVFSSQCQRMKNGDELTKRMTELISRILNRRGE